VVGLAGLARGGHGIRLSDPDNLADPSAIRRDRGEGGSFAGYRALYTASAHPCSKPPFREFFPPAVPTDPHCRQTSENPWNTGV
jgi:hypothetical protein